jgi:lauroyl/myristoyl acyltransferase
MGMGLSSFLQSQPNIFIYKRLGWRFAFYYTSVLGGLYFFFNRKDKQKIKKGIHSVFSGRKNLSERRSITLAVFRGIILHYYEKLFNAFSSPATLQTFFKIHIKNDGMGAIEKGLSKGNGVLMVTGHFGGVEFIPGYLAAQNFPVTIIVRFSSNILRNISIQKAKQFSAKIIDVDNTPNIMKAIIENLKENRIVITQCDEINEWKSYKQNRVSFLGKDIHMDRTMDILIKRVNPTLVFGLMHRESDHRYRFITTSKSKMIKSQIRSEEMPISKMALSFLERYIYRYPREWYQWKQYADIVTASPIVVQTERPASLSLLKTSLDNIS